MKNSNLVALESMLNYLIGRQIISFHKCHNIILAVTSDLHLGAPTVTYVIYRLERSSSDITCNSITSPPSNVTWALADAMFTLRDGESVTINRVKYELKQTITNRTTSAYASTLIINTTLAGDTTGYVCTVNNALGSDTKTVGEGSEF